MPKLKDLAAVASNPELLSLFGIAVKRAAYTILATANPPADQTAWAKRVLGDAGQPGRAEWYASRVLEGSLVDNAQLRDLVDTMLSTGVPIDVPDNTFLTFVQPWVLRFAAANI